MFFFLGESIDYYVNFSKLSDGFKYNFFKRIMVYVFLYYRGRVLHSKVDSVIFLIINSECIIFIIMFYKRIKF